MIKLEDLQPDTAARRILPDVLVTIVNVRWFGSEALELTNRTPAGKVANELIYRHDEPRLAIVERGRPWSFDGDGVAVNDASGVGVAVPTPAARRGLLAACGACPTM